MILTLIYIICIAYIMLHGCQYKTSMTATISSKAYKYETIITEMLKEQNINGQIEL